MSLQYYDSDNEALIPIAGNVNPSDVIELKTTKADKTQISNPNLLDNPWFTVNQRGFTGPNTEYCYGVDRWHSEGGTSISNGIMTQTKLAGNNSNFFQDIVPSEHKFLFGKVLTISIMMADGTIHSKTARAKNESDLVAGWQRLGQELYISLGNNVVVEAMVYYDTSLGGVGAIQGAIVRMNNSPDGTSVSFKAIKLELGSVSTLAMDTAPNYATELLKCQRYYLPIRQASRFVGAYISTTSVAFFVPTPVQMRVAPSVTGITKLGMGISSGAINTTSITSQTGQYNASNGVGVLVEFTSNTSPTQYSVASVCALDNDFALSADI